MKHNLIRILSLLLVFLALFALAGCSTAGAGAAEAPTEPPAMTPAAETEPEPEPAAEPEPAVETGPLDESWFDDAVFMGDSISVILKKYCSINGGLGDAVFLTEFSFGVRNAVRKDQIQISYQSNTYDAEDVIPLTGASKLFVMFGINDIELYGGIPKTMEYWQTFIENVRSKSPDIQIFIQSMLPVREDVVTEGIMNSDIDEYNSCLRAFCDETGCVYVDIASHIKGDNNAMPYEFCQEDGLHETYDACEVWIELLKDPSLYSVDPRSLEYTACAIPSDN